IANWEKLAKEMQKIGFKGLRAAGDMEVFFNHSEKELFRYEAMLGRELPPNLCALCIYDQKLLDDKQVHHLTTCHSHLINRDWAWKMT
ncbi:MAG: MEDS domain-containing protein, partial [Candidatus Bathyarchaeota archaeon]|nr:MEDS domain-containing protein [Candidatus Bathyarchaeota archaeon]